MHSNSGLKVPSTKFPAVTWSAEIPSLILTFPSVLGSDRPPVDREKHLFKVLFTALL